MTQHEVSVSLRLNGADETITVPTSEMLVDTVRERFGLKGTNIGCDQASCGACTVRVEGNPVASCSTFTWQADDRDVTTIEGLGRPGNLSPEQTAVAENSAFQCGYCTPGLLMSTSALLDTHPNPDRDTIVEWLGANICRCTGYQMIIEAVQRAAELRGGSDAS
jgi:aerobic carbon-monoxide dehydrogenase small subunit